MPTITALREERRASVAVELDGLPWRSLPVDVVVRAGLGEGLELDRARARELARELRRNRALAVSLRALERRRLSTRLLDARLERAGVPHAGRADALDTLSRVGLVDDRALALERAASLAGRGQGNLAIRWELERSGIERELVELALSSLDDERVRAERIVNRRGRHASTARLLARRGFAAEVIEEALAASASEES